MGSGIWKRQRNTWTKITSVYVEYKLVRAVYQFRNSPLQDIPHSFWEMKELESFLFIGNSATFLSTFRSIQTRLRVWMFLLLQVSFFITLQCGQVTKSLRYMGRSINFNKNNNNSKKVRRGNKINRAKVRKIRK